VRRPLRDSFLISAAALALFGLIRFVFNAVGIRVFGPEYIGVVGSTISTLTVIAVALASIPSVLAAKFVAEYRGSGDTARAYRLFSGVVIGTGFMGLLSSGALTALGRPPGAASLVCYVPLFGFYLVFKGTYFAFAYQRQYARAEAIGAVAFAIVFSAACFWRQPSLASASLLAHPLVFTLIALVDHRAFFRLHGGLAELAREWRRYGVYSIATFVNAMNGLGSYHFLVILASMFLDLATVGYLNVLLATLAPLSLIPAAYGTAGFPEMARLHGVGDVERLRSLLWRSTVALQAIAVLAAGPILVAPGKILPLLHVPPDHGLLVTWCCIAVSLQLNMTSAPAGHFLNATEHVVRHAMLSGVFLVFGTVVGVAAMSVSGAVGVGIMRFALDGPLAWARMTLAERSVRWVGSHVAQLIGGQLAILSLFASAVVRTPPMLVATLWVVAAASQLPALADVLRRPSGSRLR